MSETRNILIGGANSYDSVDDNKVITIDFNRSYDKLNDNVTHGTVDANEQFIVERDACDNYRVILTVNPFCTNVLFNACTEVVKNEGGENVIVVTENNKQYVDGAIGKNNNVSAYDMVRNTEYTKDSIGYEYHPGIDIFNNHILRNKSYRIVNYLGNQRFRDTFNTIEDYMRLSNGSNIKRCQRTDPTDTSMSSKHLYDHDDILSFHDGDAINENLREQNGWFGFYNPSNIPAKDANGNDMCIGRVINNSGACEFIDMYPDRTLFSFVPKINKERRRLEYNWDIELTYAFDSCVVDELGNDILLVQDGNVNGLAIAEAKYIIGPNGTMVLQFRTYTKHNLKPQDNVSLYFTEDKDVRNTGCTWNRTTKPYIVQYVGDLDGNNKEYYFTISDNELLDDIFCTSRHEGYSNWDYVRDYFYAETSTPYKTPVVYASNIVDGIETLGLTNIPTENDVCISVNDITYELYNHDTGVMYSSVSDVMSVDEFIRQIINNAFRDEDGLDAPDSEPDSAWTDYIQFRMVKTNGVNDCMYYVRKFKKIPNMKPGTTGIEDCTFNREQYKLGFAETIYGDPVTQILFTDNVHISTLKNNLGGSVTEVFVTIVKRNNGGEIWYDRNGDKTDPSIEFSHCFGRVTCGFKLFESNNDSLSIRRRRHALGDVRMINNCDVIHSDDSIQTIGGKTDIKIDDEWFYGDVVEFNPNRYEETTLCDVNFRFNTYQRELVDTTEYPFYYDEIYSDDYDKPINGETDPSGGVKHFSVRKYTVHGATMRPEGYFYKAHYRIKLRGLGKVNQGTHQSINVISAEPVQMDGIFIKVETMFNHQLVAGDKVILSEVQSGAMWELDIVSIPDNRTVIFNKISRDILPSSMWRDWIAICHGLNDGTYKLKKKNINIPEYATKVKNGTYMWRDIIMPWDIENQDEELTESVFTNNAFYIDKALNFYMHRQDPDNLYKLYYGEKDFISDKIGEVNKSKSIYQYKPENDTLC